MIEMIKIIFGIMSENTAPGTECPRIFCAGIGPLQLGVVLVSSYFTFITIRNCDLDISMCIEHMAMIFMDGPNVGKIHTYGTHFKP